MLIILWHQEYFNSRPHGGRRLTEHHNHKRSGISTHALTEGDDRPRDRGEKFSIFQLTPSRRATRRTSPEFRRPEDFNSRPHGGRRKTLTPWNTQNIFQLTPSRRATPFRLQLPRRITFQLTPSRRATPAAAKLLCGRWHFNSRPHGGRRQI